MKTAEELAMEYALALIDPSSSNLRYNDIINELFERFEKTEAMQHIQNATQILKMVGAFK